MSLTAPTATRGQELAEVLFNPAETPVFAVLDGASAPGLLMKLGELAPEHCCLYSGEMKPDIAAVAPYLVRLESGGEFTAWVLREGWGVHWGVFVASLGNLRTLRDHFREFLKVELPDQRTVIFRYYDPRVLRNFLPACNTTELKKFFGPVQSFVLEGETPEIGLKFALAGKALKPETIQLKPPV